MTTNKNLQQPANGSDVGYWDQPLNNNFTLIDAALGAVQQFNVGSVGPVTINVSGGTFVGAYPANTPSYVPLVMYVFGAPTGNITLQLPAGVGGQWIIWNAISNSYSYTLTVKMSGGTASVVIPNSSTRSVYCDQATGVYFSDSQTTVAGSSGQVIYNSGGSLTSSANLAFDGTTLTAANLASSTNITAGGNITATGNITAFSDRSLKRDIETIDNALTLVKNLRGVTFEMINTGQKGVGVVAQEVKAVVPQAVQENNGILSVAYGNLVGVLIEAIKELLTRIEALESK